LAEPSEHVPDLVARLVADRPRECEDADMKVVLLHGHDSTGARMAWLGRELASHLACAGLGVDVVIPEGLLELASGTRSWWLDDGAEADVTAALAHLRSTVDLDGAVLVGFSQGGALAVAAAMASGSTVRGVVCVGGFVPPGTLVRAGAAPMLVLHGDDDEVVDVFYAETLARSARKFQLDVTLTTYPCGHEWPDGAAATIAAWIARTV
jgi:predicted esterase